MIAFIYVRDNSWFKQEGLFKLGVTISIKDRSSCYITGEITRGFYVKIIELELKDEKQYKFIDKVMKMEFENLNEYHNGGTEFYKRTIIDDNKLEEFLMKYKIKFTCKGESDLKRINRKYNARFNYKKLLTKVFKEIRSNIELRDYQIKAIDTIVSELLSNNKIYLDLATGGGKSTIAYITFTKVKPETILIFSPRTEIKTQNISSKYTDIFKKNNYNPVIINHCIQSYKKVYKLIIDNNYRNLFIWFDEAHWTLDNWIMDKTDKIKQFFLNDNDKIKYRLFTSASPNKTFVINNKQLYGLLYQPIKPKELMDKNYLAKIETDIFNQEITKEEINYNSLIIKTFNKYDRKQGLSFHNNCLSAFNYYLKHLQDYNNDKIDIKPYLLINEEFIKKMGETDKEEKEELNKIKIIKKEIGEINYYSNIKEFETETKAIGYCVAKYSMGYDNNKIDILYFTDYKLSYKDITQSIGRGLRPYLYECNDGNKKLKYLRLIIPTNHNNDVCDKYKKIKEVLKYLLLELELTSDNIKNYQFSFGKSLNGTLNGTLNEKIDVMTDGITETTDIEIDTMKIDIINNKYDWNTNKIINQLKLNNIHNLDDYLTYKNNKKELNLPDINSLLSFPKFRFIDTYNEGECPYYNKEDCIRTIKLYEDEFIINDIYDDEEKLNYLIENKQLSKIPKMPFWYFYGGKRNEFFAD